MWQNSYIDTHLVIHIHTHTYILFPADTSKDGTPGCCPSLAGWILPSVHGSAGFGSQPGLPLHNYAGRREQPLSLASVSAHLATIRCPYRAILSDNTKRDVTLAEALPSDRKAFVDEMLEALRNAIDPESASVKPGVCRDVPGVTLGC